MANGWGGRRPGAGRPPNSKSKLGKRAIKKAEELDIDLVEYCLLTIKELREDEKTNIKELKDWINMTLPYVAPRLASTESTLNVNEDDSKVIVNLMTNAANDKSAAPVDPVKKKKA